jgi:hypothetical protein
MSFEGRLLVGCAVIEQSNLRHRDFTVKCVGCGINGRILDHTRYSVTTKNGDWACARFDEDTKEVTFGAWDPGIFPENPNRKPKEKAA